MFFQNKFFISVLAIFISTNTFAANTILAGGNAGDVVKSLDGGATWTKYATGLPLQFSSLTQNNNQFVGVGSMGNGVVLQSNDGIKWNTSDLPSFYPTQVIYSNNQYILIDGNDMQNSGDGKTWTNHVIPAPKNYPFMFLTSIAYGNNTYVAVGSAGDGAQSKEEAGNCIATSSDGVNWHIAIPTVSALHSVIFANNQFIATGKNGAIATSADGIQWQQQESGVADDLGRIIFSNGKYVTFGSAQGVANSSYVLTSEDAKTWIKYPINTPDDVLNLSDLTFTNNEFVLVGANNSGGVIYTSPDAQIWVQVFSGLKDANGNPEALWAVG